MPLYNPTNVDASIYNKTSFTDLNKALQLLEGDAKKVVKNLNKDAAYQYAKPMIEEFYTKINPEFQQKNQPITALQKTYMKAICVS